MITSKKRNHLRSGFTIVEIVMVVAILGTLMLVGFPALTKWVPNYKLKAATQELYANFQKAKLHAVKTNNDVTFDFSIPTCSYTFTDDDGVVVANDTLKEGVCLTSSSFTNGTSGFTPRGLPNGAVGTVTLSHSKIPNRIYSIRQSIAGGIRIL